jgi:hypothetical protein
MSGVGATSHAAGAVCLTDAAALLDARQAAYSGGAGATSDAAGAVGPTDAATILFANQTAHIEGTGATSDAAAAVGLADTATAAFGAHQATQLMRAGDAAGAVGLTDAATILVAHQAAHIGGAGDRHVQQANIRDRCTNRIAEQADMGVARQGDGEVRDRIPLPIEAARKRPCVGANGGEGHAAEVQVVAQAVAAVQGGGIGVDRLQLGRRADRRAGA